MKVRPLKLRMLYGSRPSSARWKQSTWQSPRAASTYCVTWGVAWPLCALVSLSKAWAAVRMNWVETREELQKVPHTVNSQETIDSLTTWMLCYGWWTSWNWIPSLVVSSPVPVSIYIITKERLDPDCRLYVSVSGSCAISGVGEDTTKFQLWKDWWNQIRSEYV